MKTKLNKIVLGVLIVLSGLLLTGCGSKTTNDTKTDNKPNKVDKKSLKIVDTSKNNRPYAIMINNISTARPLQSGLQDAYIIYEIIAEGGITRYMALFMDQKTERIGSIRSARHYFLDYALENDAIYVHHGQSPQALSDFKTLNIDRVVVDNSKTGWRDKTLNVATEHTLFTSIAKLNSGLGKIRTTRNNDLLLNYSVDEINNENVSNAKVAKNISIKYSNGTTTEYKYDEEHKYYLRSVNGRAHTDYVTKEQYHFKNIITYQVKNTTLNDGENKGRQTIDNIGSGNGYYITNGISIPIKWEKEARNKQTKYYYEDGKELQVNDGNTFIQIQPLNQSLTIE